MSNESNFNWDDGLRGAAKRIAETEHTPLRVVAGPDTGKTFALMRRIARLLQEGADPKHILVCTFTRTAASDLRQELAEQQVEGATKVKAGTLHSLAFSILSREEVLELLERVPRPLLRFEERFMLEDLKNAQYGTISDLKKRLLGFNAAWARLQNDEPGWPSDRVDRSFNVDLSKWLDFHEGMLIGELIPETLHYLKDNPTSQYLSHFDHVFVDEYQDLNKAEQVLIDLLSEEATLSVIGDEDQSIYSFRHAHPEGIAEFVSSHPETHDEGLAICRRCPRLVIEIANSLISFNTSRSDRRLKPRRNSARGEVHIVQWHDDEEETEGIANYVKSRIEKEEVEAGKVLIISPSRYLGYAIRNMLVENDVPAHSFFYEEAFDGNNKEGDKCRPQQAFTLLNLLVDPTDRVALRCWCGFDHNKLQSKNWSRLREYCEQNGIDPITGLQKLDAGEISLPYCSPIIERYRELIENLEELKGRTGKDLIDGLFPPDESWADPLRYIASTFDEEQIDAPALREALQTGIIQPELPTDVEYVRVMSLFRSKGLTADLVVIVGCVKGLIPRKHDPKKTDLTPEQYLEEQRRLFYVAMTRTRSTLVLSSVNMFPRSLAHQLGVKLGSGNATHARAISSPFIRQLGSAAPRAVRGSVWLREL